MAELKIKINGTSYKAPEGMSILDLCRRERIHIPTLCHHPDLTTRGICRICVVDVKGSKTLQAACSTPVEAGMEISTTTDRVRKSRKTIVELLLANHYTDCTVCPKNLNCELQGLANEFGLTDLRWNERRERTIPQDKSSPVFIRDNNKCVLCQRCVRACDDMQGVYAVANLYKGDSTIVGSAFNKPIGEVVCINCGQCVAHCPTGALSEKYCIEDIWKAIDDPKKVVVVQTAPAIRAALGEEFDYPAGTRVTGKMVSALKAMGFDYVFDTQFAADLTVIEEGYELLGRLKGALTGEGKPVLPMTTSCSPGWINFRSISFRTFFPMSRHANLRSRCSEPF